MSLRHDLHTVSCDCSVTEFTQVVDCQRVYGWCSEAMLASGGGRCEDCGAVLHVRALELVTSAPAHEFPPQAIFYKTSKPIPIGTFLAAFTPENN